MNRKKDNIRYPTLWSRKTYLKFVIPSIFGVFIFLTPVVFENKVTIPMGVIVDLVEAQVIEFLPVFITGIIALSAVMTVIITLIKKRLSDSKAISRTLLSLFDVSWPWILLRLTGSVFACLVYFKSGPEWIWSEETGGVVLYDLCSVILVIFLFASVLLPLLTDFGLMEFIGTLFRKVFRKVFRLPGRAAIDALASWLGSGTVGVVITVQQYQSGFYALREAAVIATSFSIVSVAFCLVVAQFSRIDNMFPQFYLTVIVSGLAAAFVTSRIPPLSRKENTYYAPAGKQIREAVPQDRSLFYWGLQQALERADKAPGPLGIVKKGVAITLDIWLGLLPSVMAIGTVTLALAKRTPVFRYLSYPFIPILKLLQIPEAVKAAPAMIVGFADQFLPAVLTDGIESSLTRFVIAVIAVVQLIYMSEIGVLILKSEISLSLLDLFSIFILRTLICLPIIALMAHLFFF
ncbi:MAG: YjiH family protein [Candidatus Aminicenantes bacterium]|nr:YjiH family protein [Candidatus Aminicenantes bacterium]